MAFVLPHENFYTQRKHMLSHLSIVHLNHVNQFELGRKENQPSSGKTLKKANMQLEKYSSSNLLEI
jgi:hypothetical protein